MEPSMNPMVQPDTSHLVIVWLCWEIATLFFFLILLLQWEEGIAETIIKDTWTKSGGMVGVGEGGGFSWGGGREGEKRHTTVIE